MKRFVAVGLVVLLAAGCSPAGRRSAANTLTIAQQREPRSLNPALENGTSSTELGMLFFQYLLKWNDRGEFVGDAAIAAPTQANGGVSRDGLTITYHLRRGLRFSDGVALTASDCVWSIHAIQDPANNVQTRYGYDRIARADAPDPYTLVLRLKEPFAPLPTLVLAPQGFPILPAHVFRGGVDFNHGDFNAHPIGSGPYVVEAWKHNDRIEMRANPLYAGGAPQINRMAIRFAADPNTAIDLLKTGEADGFFNDEDYSSYPELRALPGIRTTADRVNGVGAIIFNTQDPVTADARVRHALAEAIDIRSLVFRAYRGALASDDAGAGLFLWAYDRRAYPDVPYSRRHAASLLDAAGWRLGTDGVRYKEGRPLDVLLILQAQNPGEAIAANVIAAAEREVGARVSLKQFNETQLVAPANEGGPVYGGKFQMALYSFVNGDDPDTTDQFACANVPPNGYNKSRLCDSNVDALLLRARRTYDVGRRKAIYRNLEARLYAAMPIALLYQNREINAFSNRLQRQTTSLSGAFWNAGAWRLAR